MIIQTNRLELRTFEITDITEQYLSWLNDEMVTKYSNQRFARHSYSSACGYLAGFENSQDEFLLISQKIDLAPIGTATIYRSLPHRTADIGLMIGDRNVWGQGYGREAWQAILETLLDEPSIRKVTGGTIEVNRSMVRIMESTRMKIDGVRRDHELVDGQPVDLIHYACFSKKIDAVTFSQP